jgi:hypothetical protein
MFLNQSPESRQQLTDLVQTLHMSEADVVAFAIQQLFNERLPRSTARTGEQPAQPKRTRRKLLVV